jgi:predicted lysophospholipase L1 biosynthesis ABC-type transport system permease subunit
MSTVHEHFRTVESNNGGTRLNKSLVMDEMELTDGDEISAGQATFRVESRREDSPK